MKKQRLIEGQCPAPVQRAAQAPARPGARCLLKAGSPSSRFPSLLDPQSSSHLPLQARLQSRLREAAEPAAVRADGHLSRPWLLPAPRRPSPSTPSFCSCCRPSMSGARSVHHLQNAADFQKPFVSLHARPHWGCAAHSGEADVLFFIFIELGFVVLAAGRGAAGRGGCAGSSEVLSWNCFSRSLPHSIRNLSPPLVCFILPTLCLLRQGAT